MRHGVPSPRSEAQPSDSYEARSAESQKRGAAERLLRGREAAESYSCRSASTTFTRPARQAGNEDAISDVAPINESTPT
jgi:hypothetical protein